jgi:hypothetical protein
MVNIEDILEEAESNSIYEVSGMTLEIKTKKEQQITLNLIDK